MLNRFACAAAVLGAFAGPAQAAPGDISTFAGTGVAGFGGDGGPAASALLRSPVAVAPLADGSILVADYANHRIRRISPSGQVTTVAGTGTPGYAGDGGQATNARLSYPTDVEPTGDGGFLIADYANRRVRKVSAAGVITTVAGTGAEGAGGDGGRATSAQLTAPTGVAVMADGGFLVADSGTHRVRRVAPSGTITRVAGNGTAGGTGDGGPATSARLNTPVGVAVLPEGGFIVAEYEGHRVRRVSAAGVISRVAGTGVAGFSGDNGSATAAQLNKPVGVSRTPDGGFLIGDSLNNRVRKVSPDGRIVTLAGTHAGYGGDGGAAALARLSSPSGAAELPNGAVLIADTANNRLRLVEPVPPAALPPGGDTPPPSVFEGVTDRSAAATAIASAGRVRLPIVCPAVDAQRCRGTIRLLARVTARTRAAAARVVVIARGRYSVAPGDTALVKLPLTRAGRRLLEKRRSLTVKAVVARRGGPNIGGSTERATVKVKVKRRATRRRGSLARRPT